MSTKKPLPPDPLLIATESEKKNSGDELKQKNRVADLTEQP